MGTPTWYRRALMACVMTAYSHAHTALSPSLHKPTANPLLKKQSEHRLVQLSSLYQDGSHWTSDPSYSIPIGVHVYEAALSVAACHDM
jgi:hypothetical protein